jgi:hypothetical protein
MCSANHLGQSGSVSLECGVLLYAHVPRYIFLGIVNRNQMGYKHAESSGWDFLFVPYAYPSTSTLVLHAWIQLNRPT